MSSLTFGPAGTLYMTTVVLAVLARSPRCGRRDTGIAP
jgi:hypothetical protein